MIPIPTGIADEVARALAEDVGTGDATAHLIAAAASASAHVLTREAAVICGQPWFDEVFRQIDSRVRVDWHCAEGAPAAAGAKLCTLTGPARALLTGERTALNFLQTLSATATNTRRYVDAIGGTHTRILDTRKTLPLLRRAQKYAVRCGGGDNHRMGLFDAILIKENHIAAAGSVTAAWRQAQALQTGLSIEIEVEDLTQLQEALAAGAERILLDNFSVEQLREAVAINNRRARLEASGGVSVKNVRAIAETGVDFISIGSLTKSVQAIDLSMRFG